MAEDVIDELDFAPRTLGNIRSREVAEYVRDLTLADVAALEAPRQVAPSTLRRIHASHHSLARCLAAGMRASQASLVTGYTQSRISVLQNDPSFVQLVSEYRDEVKSVTADLAARMCDLSLDAIEELQTRLHEAPESFTTGLLLETIKTFADRTGHGPGAEVNLRVSSSDLIDRPPRESHDEWMERRRREIERDNELGTTAGASDRGNHGRLVS